MNIFRKIYESFVIRNNKVAVSSDTDAGMLDIGSSVLSEIISKIRDMSGSYYDKIDEFNDMLNDGIVFSAVDSIATDATILDPDKEWWHGCHALTIQSSKTR